MPRAYLLNYYVVNATQQGILDLRQAGLIITLLIVSGSLMSRPAQAYNREQFRQQRLQFIAAEQAAKTQHWPRFKKLAAQLRDYPLYPYLEYAQLSRRLPQTDERVIQQFLRDNVGAPLALQLRKKWLFSLEIGRASCRERV